MSVVTRYITRSVTLVDERKNGMGDWYTTSNRRVVNFQKKITSEYPAKKFVPGCFKISDVLLTTKDWTPGFVHVVISNVSPPPNTQGRMYWMDRPVSIPSTRSFSENYNQYLVQCACNKASMDDIGLSETLAETGKTLGMLVAPFKSMRKLLVDKVIRNRAGKLRTVQAMSDAWLEYRYGWFPLYKTAEAIWNFKDLEAKFADKGYKEYYPTSQVVRKNRSFSNPSCTMCTEVHVECLETWCGRYYYYINDLDLYNAVRRGTSIFNVPRLAWELCPFSFVIDWWYNVGDLITQMTPNPTINGIGATVSKKVEVTTKEHPISWVGTNRYFMTYSPCVLKDTSYTRKVIEFNGTLPKVNYGFDSWKHATDALALTIQLVKR